MVTIRELLKTVGESIDKDKEINTFAQPEAKDISWLAKNPRTAEEIAENIYERIRTLGFELEVVKDPSAEGLKSNSADLLGAYMARKRAIGEDTL